MSRIGKLPIAIPAGVEVTLDGQDLLADKPATRRLLGYLPQEFGVYPKVTAEAMEGRFVPGDDLLFIIVAGDIRENVKPTLADALDRIKSEAVSKQELAQYVTRAFPACHSANLLLQGSI